VILGASILTSGALEGRYDLYVRIDDAEGLTQDTRVLLQGLQIGRVRAVVPRQDPETNTLEFLATLSIRERFPDGSSLTLPVGTWARIVPPPALVGATAIEMVLPEESPSGVQLLPGDTLPSERDGGVMEALAGIAAEMRGNIEGTLADVRELVARTTSTIAETQRLIGTTRPRLDSVMDQLTTSLERTERMLAEAEPRVAPIADSVVATLASTHRAIRDLDSLTVLARGMASENREAIRETIDRLARSAEVLAHFADQVSRRPVRMLTGVTPPDQDTIPERQ
jgi:ABC-type transporter Mla subunit MlaD